MKTSAIPEYLILVRHGRTKQAEVRTVLSESGKDDIRLLAERIAQMVENAEANSEKDVYIISSEYSQAIESAEILSDYLKCAHTHNSALTSCRDLCAPHTSKRLKDLAELHGHKYRFVIYVGHGGIEDFGEMYTKTAGWLSPIQNIALFYGEAVCLDNSKEEIVKI